MVKMVVESDADRGDIKEALEDLFEPGIAHETLEGGEFEPVEVRAFVEEEQ